MIKEGLKGYHGDNEEVNNELIYWFFAHHFGFNPEQVDKLPYDRLVYMQTLEMELKKLEKNSIKNG